MSGKNAKIVSLKHVCFSVIIEDVELRLYKKQAKEILALTEEQINQWLRDKTLIEIELGEYDKLCLTPEALRDTTAQGDIAPETVNIEHTEPQPSVEREGSPLDLVTA